MSEFFFELSNEYEALPVCRPERHATIKMINYKRMKKYLITVFAITLMTSGFFARNNLMKKDTLKGSRIRSYEKTVIINSHPKEVFAFMDDIRNTGKHMTESSGAMAGSKLKIEWLSGNKTGLGTKYRWTGKVAGMKIDFTVVVSKWSEGKEKEWGTVGDAEMIVIDWFEMYLVTTPEKDEKTNVKLGINYIKHNWFWGRLLGKSYAKWCVKSMLKDTRKHFKKM